MKQKERILLASKGELPDVVPYAPRFDIWYHTNQAAGTLPEQLKGLSIDDIARREGWGLHKTVPDYISAAPGEMLHRAISFFSIKETAFRPEFSSKIRVEVISEANRTVVKYHTPLGSLQTCTLSDEAKKSSISWTVEHLIKSHEDYRIAACLFDHIRLVPDFDSLANWQQEIGDDGLPVALGMRAASPMHFVQKDLVDATTFYYHYQDYHAEMTYLAAALENLYQQALDVLKESPAEAVLWGMNFDEMITYPSFFEEHIRPWIRKASGVLGAEGKILFCHCDGENQGLMDLLKDSGMDVAEGICPYPMTKVRIEDYYRQWADKVTIFGGVPSNMLLAETTGDDEFNSFLDYLFKAVAPGKRFILGLGDTTPAAASFDRLRRIGEKAEKHGRLPFEGGSFRPLSESQIRQACAQVEQRPPEADEFKVVQQDVLLGNDKGIEEHVAQLLKRGFDANEILKKGMLSAMEVIGSRFKTGEVFIPEVLLSARAMNKAVNMLEPFLSKNIAAGSGKILIGTVHGDMHDIGKNIVISMFRGVGYEVIDMGINVPAEKIQQAVLEYEPDVLALSALLTTTMPEMGKVVRLMKEEGINSAMKIIVGGAPVNGKFARDIGADGYAPDAASAVDLVRDLLGGAVGCPCEPAEIRGEAC